MENNESGTVSIRSCYVIHTHYRLFIFQHSMAKLFPVFKDKLFAIIRINIYDCTNKM